MLSIFLSTLIVAVDIEPQIPDPFLGFEASLFPYKTTENAARVARRKKFLTLGFPFEVGKFESKDTYDFHVIGSPELQISLAHFGFSALVGFEQSIPTGFRQIPSAFFWGLLGGGHVSVFYDSGGHVNDSGSKMTFYDQTTLAFQLKTYLGPRFQVSDRFAIKLQMGTSWFIGKISRPTYRVSFSRHIGATFFGNFQVDF